MEKPDEDLIAAIREAMNALERRDGVTEEVLLIDEFLRSMELED